MMHVHATEATKRMDVDVLVQKCKLDLLLIAGRRLRSPAGAGGWEVIE